MLSWHCVWLHARAARYRVGCILFWRVLSAVEDANTLGQASSLHQGATYLEVPLLRRILHWLHATNDRQPADCKHCCCHQAVSAAVLVKMKDDQFWWQVGAVEAVKANRWAGVWLRLKRHSHSPQIHMGCTWLHDGVMVA